MRKAKKPEWEGMSSWEILTATAEKEVMLEVRQINKWIARAKRVKHGEHTCWLHTGTITKDGRKGYQGGYAEISVGHKTRLLGRLIVSLQEHLPYAGDWVAGHKTPVICRIGNRHCINPEHLQSESQSQSAARRERDARALKAAKEMAIKLKPR